MWRWEFLIREQVLIFSMGIHDQAHGYLSILLSVMATNSYKAVTLISLTPIFRLARRGMLRRYFAAKQERKWTIAAFICYIKGENLFERLILFGKLAATVPR